MFEKSLNNYLKGILYIYINQSYIYLLINLLIKTKNLFISNKNQIIIVFSFSSAH